MQTSAPVFRSLGDVLPSLGDGHPVSRDAHQTKRLKMGQANAARVSRGSEVDIWPGLSVSSPQRDFKEHITITVVIYNTIAGPLSFLPAFASLPLPLSLSECAAGGAGGQAGCPPWRTSKPLWRTWTISTTNAPGRGTSRKRVFRAPPPMPRRSSHWPKPKASRRSWPLNPLNLLLRLCSGEMSSRRPRCEKVPTRGSLNRVARQMAAHVINGRSLLSHQGGNKKQKTLAQYEGACAAASCGPLLWHSSHRQAPSFNRPSTRSTRMMKWSSQ